MTEGDAEQQHSRMRGLCNQAETEDGRRRPAAGGKSARSARQSKGVEFYAMKQRDPEFGDASVWVLGDVQSEDHSLLRKRLGRSNVDSRGSVSQPSRGVSESSKWCSYGRIREESAASGGGSRALIVEQKIGLCWLG